LSLNLPIHKRYFKGRCLLKAYKIHNSSIPWQCETLNTPPSCIALLSIYVYNGRGDPILSKALKLWYHDKVHWALFFHNPSVLWQCKTLNRSDSTPTMWVRHIECIQPHVCDKLNIYDHIRQHNLPFIILLI
jgi:hypothetical protein